MTTHRIPLPRVLLLAAGCMLPILACSAGSTGGSTPTSTAPGTTPTPTPVPCATTATASALVWVQGQQVAGSIPASAGPVTLSNFVYPLGIPDENAVGNSPFPTFIAVAPDAQHLAVAIAQYVPFETEYDPYIVNPTTHAVTRIPLSGAIKVATEEAPHRLFTWADDNTLIIFNGTGAQSYDVATNSLTTLPGVGAAVEGVVRCSTLFYSTYNGINAQSSPIVPEQINRYDLTTHAAIGNPYTISQAGTWGGAEGHVEYGGWAVSNDGSHVAYQDLALTLTTGGGGLNESSHWYAANADGSGVVSILPSVTSNTMAAVAISPDGTHVAVANANPTPNVASGPLAGGPARFYDSPAGYSLPAWRADSGAFYSDTSNDPFTSGSIGLYTLGSAAHATGTTPYVGVHFPASLP